jgi:hypothetical protein
VLRMACGRSKELNASQHADKGLFRDGDRRPERERESGRSVDGTLVEPAERTVFLSVT